MSVPDALLPRLDLDQMPEDLQALLRPRVDRLGYLGEFFRCSAHEPQALVHFVGLTERLKDALPPAIVELVALTCANLLGNDYERNQHHRLCIALGLGDRFVADVEAGCAGETRVPEPLATCQAYVRAACGGADVDVAPTFVEVCRLLGPQRAVAVAFTAARYTAHALVVRSYGLAPPVPAAVERTGRDAE